MILRFLLILLLLSACAYPQTLTYKSLSVDNGLPGGAIYYALQDSKGFIWLGTKNGVVFWDSKEFKTFTVEDGIPNNEVIYIYEGQNGRIWFSCFSKELSYYYNGKIYNSKSDTALKNLEIYPGSKIIELHNELYFSSINHFLYKYNFTSHKKTSLNIALPKDFYLINDKNKIWSLDFTNKERNHLISETDSFYTNYFLQPNFSDAKIITKVDYRNKKYYFQYGLNAPFDSFQYLSNDFKFALFNKGNIAEVYKNKLVFKRSHRSIDVAFKGFPLLFSSNDYSIFLGEENVFVNHQQPILEFKLKAIEGTDFKYLYHDKNRIYGINAAFKIIDLKNSTIANKIADDVVGSYNIINYDSGFLLTTSRKIYQLNGPNIKGLNNEGMGNFKQVSLNKQTNWLYCATGNWGISAINYKEKKKKRIFKNPMIPVYTVFEDRSSRLWFASLNKVFYTRDYRDSVKNIKTFVLDSSISVFCNDITEDKNGNIFFATNAGVFIFDGVNKYKIDKTHFLTDNICNKLLLSLSDNSFWVATQNGLNHIQYVKQNGALHFKIINRFFNADGLYSNTINDIMFFNKALYIATNKGVNVLEDLNYRPKAQSIPIYLKLNAVNGLETQREQQQDIQLNDDQNNLSWKFSALYFLRRDRLKIRAYLYRNNHLITQNEVTRDAVDYNSLNDGSYKLILGAYDRDYNYIKGQSTPFYFTVSPPFYKRIWFVIITGLAAVFVISGLLFWSLSRRKDRLLREARLNAELNKSTLKSLQSQMNPHFVFNSLNTIQYFITSKNEQAALDYLSDFSSLIREMLEQSRNTLISLEDEIPFLKRYLELECIRFNYGFDAFWNVLLAEDDLADTYIPTMLIQPILENAIKHGISNLIDSKGRIDIEISLQNENLLQVVISDNGDSKKGGAEKGNLIAVQAIKDRLKVYTKNGENGTYHLNVVASGAIATITIPI
jgi:signal transduction histidine kinase